MTRRTKTFKPGTLVASFSNRSVLQKERVYRVLKCHEDQAICFVTEHPHGPELQMGVSTEGLHEVMPCELTEDQSYLKRPNFWHQE